MFSFKFFAPFWSYCYFRVVIRMIKRRIGSDILRKNLNFISCSLRRSSEIKGQEKYIFQVVLCRIVPDYNFSGTLLFLYKLFKSVFQSCPQASIVTRTITFIQLVLYRGTRACFSIVMKAKYAINRKRALLVSNRGKIIRQIVPNCVWKRSILRD